jgi:endonuclease/exonuclease/phosphatase family metal-dependent hydrolase
MTFNIRIDVPVDGKHQWKYRIPRVLERIQAYQPDFLLLQEATQTMLADLHTLANEYDYYFVGRNHDLTGEGCPIFYKKSRFQVIHQDTIWLSKQPRTPGSMDEEEGFPRLASCVTLKHHHGIIRVINCHLAYRSKRNQDLNLKVLFDFAQSFQDDVPTFIAGDFNMTVTTMNPYKPRQFIFAIDEKNLPTYHAFNGLPGISKIDHILYDHHLKCLRVEVIHDTDEDYASDHYPVIGTFTHES